MTSVVSIIQQTMLRALLAWDPIKTNCLSRMKPSVSEGMKEDSTPQKSKACSSSLTKIRLGVSQAIADQ